LDTSNENSISLNKYISNTGICSRRGANQLIADKKVKINGNLAELGNRVFPGDDVTIDNKPLKSAPKSIYVALNKPIGIVCTTDKKERKNIVDFINHKERLFPIGRLDKPSQGLIFLTNDGDIVNKILRAGNSHEKEYVVRVDKIIDQKFISQMASGIPMLGTVTKKCKVSKINKTVFKITLTQGLNRQIRRMCEYLGYDVKTLKRTRIMNVELGKLKVGEWRYLTKNEITQINSMVSDSSKTAD
jgi:23S rRNA pseudouridine2604 synthase